MLKLIAMVIVGSLTFVIITMLLIFFLCISPSCTKKPEGCYQKTEVNIGEPSSVITDKKPPFEIDEEFEKEIRQMLTIYDEGEDHDGSK